MTGGTRVGRPGRPELSPDELVALKDRVAPANISVKRFDIWTRGLDLFATDQSLASITVPGQVWLGQQDASDADAAVRQHKDNLIKTWIAPTSIDDERGDGFVVLKLTSKFVRFVEAKAAILQALFANDEYEVQPGGRPAQLGVTATFECTTAMTVWDGLNRNTNGYWELCVDPYRAQVVFCESDGDRKSKPLLVSDLVEKFASQMPDEVVLYASEYSPEQFEQRLRDFLEIINYTEDEKQVLISALEPSSSFEQAAAPTVTAGSDAP